MKRFSLLALICAATLLLSDSLANAQPPGGRPGQGGGRQGGPGGGGPGGGRGQGMGGSGAQQTPPLLRIIDADGDGELSAKEIDDAANALRKLDRNRDGKLSAEELRPAGPSGQQGRQGQQRGQPQGAMQGGRPGGGRPGQGGGRPADEPPRGGGGGRGGDPAQADAAFASELMSFDENKDNALSQSELPEHMHEAFALSDTNKDGTLDQAERLVLASQFQRNKLNPVGGDPVNAPTEGRRPAGQR